MTPPFPDKRYDVIYADPPWEGGGKHYSTLSPHVHYPVMSQKELEALPVASIANDDCLLFMWTTSPELDQAIDVGRVWGFDYITVGFVWDKQRTLPSFYTLSQVELCLIFKKGRIPKPRGKRNIKQMFSQKRGRHSEKPDEIRQRIVEMFPEQSKIELFARTDGMLFVPKGWDYWGNEA